MNKVNFSISNKNGKKKDITKETIEDNFTIPAGEKVNFIFDLDKSSKLDNFVELENKFNEFEKNSCQVLRLNLKFL